MVVRTCMLSEKETLMWSFYSTKTENTSDTCKLTGSRDDCSNQVRSEWSGRGDWLKSVYHGETVACSLISIVIVDVEWIFCSELCKQRQRRAFRLSHLQLCGDLCPRSTSLYGVRRYKSLEPCHHEGHSECVVHNKPVQRSELYGPVRPAWLSRFSGPGGCPASGMLSPCTSLVHKKHGVIKTRGPRIEIWEKPRK